MPELNPWKHLVLCFGKALTQQPMLLTRPNDKGSLYISLGYFDSLQIYPLHIERDSDWLSSLYTHNVNLSSSLDHNSYFHPVHCIAGGDNPDDLSQFMNRSAPYLFVTLFQGKIREGQPLVEDWEQLVRDYLVHNVGESINPAEDQVSWLLYRSITLSNLVILWKSNSVLAIMKAIEQIYYAPMVGDMHSIPAIRADSIMESRDAPPIREENLPQVTIRYLIRSAKAAYDFFTTVCPEEDMLPHFTIGVEDLTFVANTWTTRRLQKMLLSRLTDQNYLRQFQQAFAECETHLGRNLASGGESIPGSCVLGDRCIQLLEDFQNLRSKLEDDEMINYLDGPWLKAASELFNALSDLGRNMMADGFCFLVLDAAALFYEKMSKAEIYQPLSDSQLQRVQRFLRGWGNLMEQVLRTDGKFSQQSGFNPPSLCDVPSNLLEFYLAFTTLAGRTMQFSGGGKETFSLLLVPKLCRRIKVESVFIQRPPCSRLLYVDIPISMLYDPIAVLCHLTHEISHFTGAEWRMRRFRTEKYFDICATELAARLMFRQDKTREIIRKNLPQLSDNFPIYLEDLPVKMRRCLKTLLDDQNVLDRWLEQEYGDDNPYELANMLSSNMQIQGIKSALTLWPDQPLDPFFRTMAEFEFLFRECYADVAMIFALNLTPEEYLELSAKEWDLYQRSNAEYGPGYYSTVERWAAVLHSLFPGQPLSILEGDSPLAKFKEDIISCTRFLSHNSEIDPQERQTFQERYHRPASMELLTEYLKNCYATMEGTCGRQKEELEKLRTAFRDLAQENDVATSSCRDIVSMYRKTVLNK